MNTTTTYTAEFVTVDGRHTTRAWTQELTVDALRTAMGAEIAAAQIVNDRDECVEVAVGVIKTPTRGRRTATASLPRPSSSR